MIKPLRIVVRIEITTLYDSTGKFDQQKMDRITMLLSNINNSGMQLLVISSGAILLGAEKLNIPVPEKLLEMQAVAAVGQVELMKFYQQHFDQYNQMAAQVLLTNDIMNNPVRVKNTQNTFNRLLEKNIIPIINENDPVSTTDIEYDDNYPLALNVAKITSANIIMIKTDNADHFILVPRGGQAQLVDKETELIDRLEKFQLNCNNFNHGSFPNTIEELEFVKVNHESKWD